MNKNKQIKTWHDWLNKISASQNEKSGTGFNSGKKCIFFKFDSVVGLKRASDILTGELIEHESFFDEKIIVAQAKNIDKLMSIRGVSAESLENAFEAYSLRLTEDLENYIDEAKDIKLLYEELLSDNPDNFAYKISIKSTEKHIEELQYQLKQEKEKRNKEIIESEVYETSNQEA